MPADGMAPTLRANDSLAWSPYADASAAAVGDIVLFRATAEEIVVSRVVGVGPTTVQFDDHLLSFTGGAAMENTPLDHACAGEVGQGGCAVFGEIDPVGRAAWRVQRMQDRAGDSPRATGQWAVGAGLVFVAGDNRVRSHDSRVGGEDGEGRPVPASLILGRVIGIDRDGQCQPPDPPPP